jgi:hypothetical protein
MTFTFPFQFFTLRCVRATNEAVYGTVFLTPVTNWAYVTSGNSSARIFKNKSGVYIFDFIPPRGEGGDTGMIIRYKNTMGSR